MDLMQMQAMFDSLSSLTNNDPTKMVTEMQKTMDCAQSSNETKKEQMEAQIKEMMSAANEAKKRNKVPPKARPYRNRQEMVMKYYMLEMQMCMPKQRNQNRYELAKTFVTGESHSCVLPINKLTPIFLRQMEVPKIHLGKFLVCRTISKGKATVGTTVLVEDLNGDVEELGLYNFRPALDRDGSWIAPGTILAIKEPYLKYGIYNVFIRIDSPSDVLFVQETDEKSLEEVGAMKWYKKDELSFEKLKTFGNDCYRRKDHSEALKYYDRAFRICPATSEKAIDINKRRAIIHLNKAAVFLELKRFYEAYTEAKTAIETESAVIDVEKALYRLAIAAYGLREWDSACQHFQELIRKFPNTKTDAFDQLARTLLRLKEAKGVYNIERLYDESCVKRRLDVADYRGPISIEEIPNKGKGYVATEDIAKGTLLLAEKAFSCAFDDESEGILFCLNTITNICQEPSKLLTIIGAIDKLRYNPSKRREFYSLYAGPGFPRSNEQQNLEGFIDAARIECICTFNCFGIGIDNSLKLFLNYGERSNVNKNKMCGALTMDSTNDTKKVGEKFADKKKNDEDGTGLFIHASFFNHSCLENATRSFYADLMMVYAVNDIKKGEEITLFYHNPLDDYSEREEHFQRTLGFKCVCKLCDLERKDPKRDERKALLSECSKYLEMSRTNPNKVIAGLTPLLKKLERTYKKGRMHEFRHHLHDPYTMLANSYGKLQNFDKSLAFVEKALQCFPAKFAHHWVCLKEQIHLAQNYIFIGRLSDAKICLQNAMTVCRHSMGIDKELFQKLFPLSAEARTILCTTD